MDVKLVICSLLLILLGSCNGTGPKGIAAEIVKKGRDHDRNNARVDIRIEQLHSSDSDQDPHPAPSEGNHFSGLTSSHTHHMDPAAIVFFFLEDLKLGNSMPIYFPRRELSDSLAHLLSREEADSIPFSSRELDHLLRLFSFSRDSPQATAMRLALDQCEREPIEGETIFCATSWESMSDFLGTVFGSDTPIKSLSTTHLKRSDRALVQKYTIVSFQEIPAPKMVACHTMPYVYAVFYCHYQESGNRVYGVSLSGEKGDEVEAIAVCHMDTAHWGRNHVAFKVLGIEPGSSPVCHFFPADNFVWVPSTTSVRA